MTLGRDNRKEDIGCVEEHCPQHIEITKHLEEILKALDATDKVFIRTSTYRF
jgi:predicted aldo/keto reductase-like oxidoreductase